MNVSERQNQFSFHVMYNLSTRNTESPSYKNQIITDTTRQYSAAVSVASKTCWGSDQEEQVTVLMIYSHAFGQGMILPHSSFTLED